MAHYWFASWLTLSRSTVLVFRLCRALLLCWLAGIVTHRSPLLCWSLVVVLGSVCAGRWLCDSPLCCGWLTLWEGAVTGCLTDWCDGCLALSVLVDWLCDSLCMSPGTATHCYGAGCMTLYMSLCWFASSVTHALLCLFAGSVTDCCGAGCVALLWLRGCLGLVGTSWYPSDVDDWLWYWIAFIAQAVIVAYIAVAMLMLCFTNCVWKLINDFFANFLKYCYRI